MCTIRHMQPTKFPSLIRLTVAPSAITAFARDEARAGVSRAARGDIW